MSHDESAPDWTSRSIETAIAWLNDERPRVRRFGAAVVTRHYRRPQARAAIPSLRAALNDDVPRVYVMVARALALLGDSIDAAIDRLIELVTSGDEARRGEAIDAIGAIGREAQRARATLVDALRHPSSSIRSKAVQALSLIGAPPEVVGPALVEVLGDADPEVADTATGMLEAIGRPAVPALVVALDHPSEDVRRQAVKCLKAIRWVPGRLAADLLRSLARGDDWAERRLVVRLFPPDTRLQALTWLDGPAAPLIDALPQGDEDMRRAIVGALARHALSDLDALFALVHALEDESSRVSWRASEALAAIASANPVLKTAIAQAVQRQLNEGPSQARLTMINCLGTIGGDQETVADLRRFASEPELREAAAWALWEIAGEAGPTEALLGEAIAAGNTERVYRFAKRIGGAALAVLPIEHVLQRLRNSDEEERRQWAYLAARLAPERPEVEDLFNTGDVNVRWPAAAGLADAGRSALPSLRRRLDEVAAGVRWEALKAIWLMEHRSSEVVEPLLGMLDGDLYDCKDRELFNGELAIDDLRSVWPGSVTLLEEMARRDADVLPLLLRLVHAGSSVEALNACRVLASVGVHGEQVADRIDALAGLDEWPMPIATLEVAWLMAPKASRLVPALVDRLGDSYWLYRWYAAQALANIGPRAAAAVSCLGDALDDVEHVEVREAAATALARIAADVGAMPVMRLVVRSPHVRREVSRELAARPGTWLASSKN